MKFRSAGVKHEHHNIHGITNLLKEFADWIEVKLVIPGVFHPVHESSRTPKVSVRQVEPSNVKIAVHLGNFIQEVRLETADTGVLLNKLGQRAKTQQAHEKSRLRHHLKKQSSRNRSEDCYD